MKRRKFLEMSAVAMGASAVSFPGITNSSDRSQPTQPAGIAVQLYSVRKEIERDLKGTLNRIAKIGYDTVETAFWPREISLKQAAAALREAGLNVCSAHIELPQGAQKEVMPETARELNCRRMIWHGWPEDLRYGSLEGTKQLADIYNEASRFARSNNLEFGIHNHWWEFRNKVDGRYVYEVLLDLLDPEIFFEIDTYWVKVAGHDPAEVVKKFGKRASLLHIKDGPARWHDSLADDNPDPMVPVGRGSQNFPAIVQAAGGNTQWMIVEMDKVEGDVFKALEDSYTYLVENGMARGK